MWEAVDSLFRQLGGEFDAADAMIEPPGLVRRGEMGCCGGAGRGGPAGLSVVAHWSLDWCSVPVRVWCGLRRVTVSGFGLFNPTAGFPYLADLPNLGSRAAMGLLGNVWTCRVVHCSELGRLGRLAEEPARLHVWIDLGLVRDAELNASFVEVVSVVLRQECVGAVNGAGEETCNQRSVGMACWGSDERCNAYKVLV